MAQAETSMRRDACRLTSPGAVTWYAFLCTTLPLRDGLLQTGSPAGDRTNGWEANDFKQGSGGLDCNWHWPTGHILYYTRRRTREWDSPVDNPGNANIITQRPEIGSEQILLLCV